MTANRQRTFTIVIGSISEIQIALGTNERGETFFPAPIRQTERAPFIVILGLTAKRDARVHCRRSADHTTTRKFHAKQRCVVRAMPQIPIVRRHRVARAVTQIVRQMLGLIIRPSLEQRHFMGIALGQSRCDDCTGRPSPNNDPIHALRVSTRGLGTSSGNQSAVIFALERGHVPIAFVIRKIRRLRFTKRKSRLRCGLRACVVLMLRTTRRHGRCLLLDGRT